MRTFQFPIELEKLTPEQLNQLHLWLDEFSYRVTLEKLRAEFGIKITQSKLHRYNQKRELADEICAEEDLQIDMKEWYNLINASPVPYDQATLKLLSKKVFEYLLNPAHKITASALSMLHRLATYETTLDLKLRRLALAEARDGLTAKSPNSRPAAAPTTNPPRAARPAPDSNPKPTPPAPASASTAQPTPAPKSGLVFPSPFESIISPPPVPPEGAALVTQIINQLPKNLGAKPGSPILPVAA